MKTWIKANLPLFREILQHLDTPLSLSVWLQIEAGEWDALALRWCNPLHYPEGVFSALRYRSDVQAIDLFRKAPLPTSIDRRDAAMHAWEDAETQCFQSNEFIDRIVSKAHSLNEYELALGDYLQACKKRLGRWLGRLPDDLDGGFGPGTCVEFQGDNPTVVDKVYLTPTTTPDAAQLFLWAFDQTIWSRQRQEGHFARPGVSPGNRLTTVPKDGKTDRPISIEPVGNLWLQLGIGRYLKKRLSLIGLPVFAPASRTICPGLETKVEDAQSVHRDFLFRCSSEGFSTLDLSSASDTLCRSLVQALLPEPWYLLLDSCRSKKTFVPSEGQQGGSWRYVEKFSSMGNGFTFELESFVFTTLLSVAFELTPGVDLFVFGDDIILPKRFFDSACNLLSTFGFTPNRRKSFKDGPFFESCGGNVHTGLDVTPVRISEELDEPPELFAFHNALRRRGFPPSVLRRVKRLIPRKLHLPGPERLGDIVLHARTFPIEHRGSIAWVKSLKVKPRYRLSLDRWSPELHMTALLVNSLRSRVVRRDSPVDYLIGETSVS